MFLLGYVRVAPFQGAFPRVSIPRPEGCLKAWAIVSDRSAVWTAGFGLVSLGEQALITPFATASSVPLAWVDHKPGKQPNTLF